MSKRKLTLHQVMVLYTDAKLTEKQAADLLNLNRLDFRIQYDAWVRKQQGAP